MDEQQKNRVIALAVAGLFLIGGGVAWVIYGQSQAEKAESLADANLNQTPVTKVADNTASQTNTAAPDGAAQNTPAQTANTDSQSQAPAANTQAQTPANPPQASTPANPPAASTPSNPPVASTPANPLAASTPANPPVASKPVQTIAPAQPPAQSSPNNNQNLIASANIPETAPVVHTPAPAGKYRSTSRDEAIATAKQIAGRQDPMLGSFDKESYPGSWTLVGSSGGRTTGDDEREELEKRDKESNKGTRVAGASVVPPPPPRERPVPPPPPASGAGSVAEAPSLPIDTLPLPPDKPSIATNLKLSAIVGNKAMLRVPLRLRQENKWPAVICLGPGERFEDPSNGTFTVVSVDRDSVTIEEDQERSVKSLPSIR